MSIAAVHDDAIALPKPQPRALLRLLRLGLAVARRGIGVQRGQKPPRPVRNLLDRAVERLGVGLRRRLKPDNFRTNCSAEARISSSVAGGSKLNSVLMLRHIGLSPPHPSSSKDERRRQNATSWPFCHRMGGAFTPVAPANSEFQMSHVTYKIVEHDGGWAYTVNGVFSEPFPNRATALAAAKRAAAEQRVPGRTEAIEYETPTANGIPRPPPAATVPIPTWWTSVYSPAAQISPIFCQPVSRRHLRIVRAGVIGSPKRPGKAAAFRGEHHEFCRPPPLRPPSR